MVSVSKKALSVIYLDVFINLVGFGIILPLLPEHVSRLTVEAGFPTQQGRFNGITMAAYSLGQLIGSPIVGSISDRVGRRPVFLMCLFFQAAFFIGTGFAYELTLLIVLRFLTGIFGATISVGFAYITDVTTPKERPTYAGFLGACIGLGFTVGPALGAAVASLGFGGGLFLAGGLGFFNFLIAVMFLNESKQMSKGKKATNESENDVEMGAIGQNDNDNDKADVVEGSVSKDSGKVPENGEKSDGAGTDPDGDAESVSVPSASSSIDVDLEVERESQSEAEPGRKCEIEGAVDAKKEEVHVEIEKEEEEESRKGKGSIKYLLNDRSRTISIITHLLMYTGFAMMESMYGVFGLHKFAMGPEMLGLVFMGLGIVLIVVQGGVVRVVVKKFGLKVVLGVACVILAAAQALLAISNVLWLLIFVTMFVGLGMGLHQSTQQTLLSILAPHSMRGAYLGLAEGTAALSRTIGPLIGGEVYDIMPGLPFFFAGGLAVCGGIMYMFIDSPLLHSVRHTKEDEENEKKEEKEKEAEEKKEEMLA